MTAADIKKMIFSKTSVESDSGKTAEQKKLVEQNVNEVSSILARLDSALAANGMGGLSISSGYRSTASQTAIYNKNSGNGSHSPVPSTAKPGTSAHEWGSGIDCRSKSGSFDDFIKFSMKWFSSNGIKFDQLIDESSSSSNPCGWLHVGLTRLGKKENCRNEYCIMWGGTHVRFKTIDAYIEGRNKRTNGAGSGPSATSDNSQDNNPDAWGGHYPGEYSNDAPGLKAMTAEEIATAKQLYDDEEAAALAAAMAAANQEWQSLVNNANVYGDYSVEEIMEAEASHESLSDDDIPLEEATSPLADQVVQIESNKNESTINIIDQGDSTANADQLQVAETKTEEKIQHTRIYQMFKSTIQLDEMSLSLEGANSRIDPSTGIHIDENVGEGGKPTSQNDMNGSNITKTIGHSAPLVRINDAYFSEKNIVKFKLETNNIIPTITLDLATTNQDLIKDNAIKDGDICSVFIQQDNDMLKSYRGDFKITYSNVKQKKTNDPNPGLQIKINGELYIPALYNGNNTFSFTGTSSDAIQDVASRLGLGFFFCDDENTNDAQVWHCVAGNNTTQNNIKYSPVIKYIKKVTSHAYKDPNSFYKSWIDPRYGISFLNINKLLGADGLDETVDMSFFNNAMTNSIATTGDTIDESSTEKYKQRMPKIFSNISSDAMGMSEFYVTGYKELIDNDISDTMGLYKKQIFNIKNTGLDKEDNKIEFTTSLCVNQTKLEHGFSILTGQGQNFTYNQADNGNYAESHTTVTGGAMTPIQSDIDAESIVNEQSNMSSSGNVHKFYEVAKQHNNLNNSQLLKRRIQVMLNGKNFQIMRGEKIPMLITKGRTATADTIQLSEQNPTILSSIDELASGWFIIDGITWIYDSNKSVGGTFWETEVKLARREWPIPGWTEKNKELVDDKTIIVTNNISDETTIDSKQDDTIVETTDGSLPTNGLSEKLIGLWNIIQSVAKENNNTVKLVGARRWAADESGQRIEGQPIIQDGNVWKFVNAKGEIMWFSDKSSPHLYGNAIDIINGTGTNYTALIKGIFTNYEVLSYLLENGLYGAQEVSKDDTGNTVTHFHIGVPTGTNNDQGNFWSWIIKLNGDIHTFNWNNINYNIDQYLQYDKEI